MAHRHPKDGSGSSAPMANEAPARDASGDIDGRHVAAQDIIAAIHEKSANKLMEALANFHDMHAAKGERPTVPPAPETD